jgi:hypothetical protein
MSGADSTAAVHSISDVNESARSPPRSPTTYPLFFIVCRFIRAPLLVWFGPRVLIASAQGIRGVRKSVNTSVVPMECYPMFLDTEFVPPSSANLLSLRRNDALGQRTIQNTKKFAASSCVNRKARLCRHRLDENARTRIHMELPVPQHGFEAGR